MARIVLFHPKAAQEYRLAERWSLVAVLSPSFPNSRLGTHARKLRFPNGWKPKSLTANP
jgi:hypothetical protein